MKRPVGWHYAEIARRHGLYADEERMDSAFRRVWGMQRFRRASPGAREDDDRAWWKKLALDVLRAATSSAPGIDQEAWFEELYWHFAKPGVWFLYDDAKRCLEQIAGRFRLAASPRTSSRFSSQAKSAAKSRTPGSFNELSRE